VISASWSRALIIVVWILQVLMGCLFIFAGVSKLVGVTEMVSGSGFVMSSESWRLVAPVRCSFPIQAFYGAVVHSASLVGHIIIHAAVLHRPATFLLLLLAATLLIAYLRRPLAQAGDTP
jgi:uncharacterized membrane protein YphA (DoxX/SURF4 family)